MQRSARRKNQPGRKPARWTLIEIGMLAIAVLMIIFPLYAEAYRWVNPLVVPAASRSDAGAAGADSVGLQRVTDTPVSGATSPPATSTSAAATNTPGASTPTNTTVPATNTSAPPTNTPGASTPTNTTVPPTDTPGASTPTNTTVPPTDTPGASTPTNTTVPPTTAPTNTAIPGTPTSTLTPIPNDAPLRLFKSASSSAIAVGQQYNYTISVFSNSTTPSTVDVRDTIDSQLDIVSASASKGSCTTSGNLVTCNVPVQNNQPVTIDIAVKVKASATLGGRISNRALAQDDRNLTAASDTVSVDVSKTGPPAPTNTPGGPTNTPSAPTNTPSGPTDTPSAPTNTPGGPTDTPAATSAPQPTSKPGSGSGGSGSGSDSSDQPTPPLLPPLPPTPQPGVAPRAPTARPGQAPAGARRTSVAGPTATATASPAPTEVGSYFRMASDWGSAFTEQEVNYVIAFRNTFSKQAINNLVISSVLPANLQILEQKSDHGDPQIQGNQLTLKVASLAAGQGVEIAVRAKIKADVAVGTRLVSQAEASFDGQALPQRSNVVTVLIVGSALGPSSAGAQAATPTAAASATATPSATAAPPTPTDAISVAAAAATVAPTATASASAGGAAPQLPATSTGVPISGMALLGLTMLLRTVRLHREKSRI